MTKILSKAEIVQVVDLKTQDVEVPEWGGAVRVREFTAADRDAFEQSMVKIGADGKREANMANMRAKLVSMSIVDAETGDLMFTADELELLGRKSAAALDRVFTVAQRLNGLGADDVADAEKNSASGPDGSSPSV